MPGLLPNVDPDGLLEFSVVYTDRSLNNMSEEFKKYKYEYIEKPENEYEIDKILGKQIMIHLGEFFNKSIKNKTRRSISNKKKTQRNY